MSFPRDPFGQSVKESQSTLRSGQPRLTAGESGSTLYVMARSPFAVAGLCFAFFLVANPAYFISCSSAEEEGFQYDEADMLEIVEQLNEAEHLAIDFPTELSGYQVGFQLQQSSAVSSEKSARLVPRQSSWVESAHACDNRTFVKAAAACVSVSSLLLEGTVQIKGGEEVVQTFEVRGALEVYSNLLTRAQFRLDAEGVELSLVWTDEDSGTFSGVEVYGDWDLPPLNAGLGGDGGGR